MTETAEDIAEALKLWTAAEVLALLDRQGWPEWVDADEEDTLRLCFKEGEVLSVTDTICGLRGGGPYLVRMEKALALAILRDDSRRKLAAAGVFIMPDQVVCYGVWFSRRYAGLLPDGTFQTTGYLPHPFHTYDEALIAGRRAIE